MSFPPAVFILAGVRLYREGLVQALEADSRVRVAGSASPTPTRGWLTLAGEFDIVLLDTATGDKELIQEIAEQRPDTKVIAFALTSESQLAIDWAEAGASGYVPREAGIDELVDTIIRVASGEFPCSPEVAGLMAHRLRDLSVRQQGNALDECLTRRELQVAELIDSGLSNKEIARRLSISLSTVKHHVHHILHKTGTSRRTHATARLRGNRPSPSMRREIAG